MSHRKERSGLGSGRGREGCRPSWDRRKEGSRNPSDGSKRGGEYTQFRREIGDGRTPFRLEKGGRTLFGPQNGGIGTQRKEWAASLLSNGKDQIQTGERRGYDPVGSGLKGKRQDLAHSPQTQLLLGLPERWIGEMTTDIGCLHFRALCLPLGAWGFPSLQIYRLRLQKRTVSC